MNRGWDLLVRWGIILGGAYLLAAWMLHSSGLSAHIDKEWIDQQIRAQGIVGIMLFSGITALAMALGFPRQAVALLGGYAFGSILGLALAWLSTIAACVIDYAAGRVWNRATRWGKDATPLLAFVRRHPFRSALIVRLLPVGSNFATSMAAGVAHVPASPFFAGSALGYLPQTVVFVLIGSGLSISAWSQLILALLLFVLATWLGRHLLRHYRHEWQPLDSTSDEPIERKTILVNGDPL